MWNYGGWWHPLLQEPGKLAKPGSYCLNKGTICFSKYPKEQFILQMGYICKINICKANSTHNETYYYCKIMWLCQNKAFQISLENTGFLSVKCKNETWFPTTFFCKYHLITNIWLFDLIFDFKLHIFMTTLDSLIFANVWSVLSPIKKKKIIWEKWRVISRKCKLSVFPVEKDFFLAQWW